MFPQDQGDARMSRRNFAEWGLFTLLGGAMVSGRPRAHDARSSSGGQPRRQSAGNFRRTTPSSRVACAEEVQRLIDEAAEEGRDTVRVPEQLLPYDASAVEFDPDVRMACQGTGDGIYNLRAYGAVGDGSGSDEGSDDTAAIEAWARAADGRGEAYVPPGQYRFTKTLNWEDRDLSVRGAGVRRSVLVFDSDGDAIRLHRESVYFKDFAVKAVGDGHRNGLVVDAGSPGTGGGMQNTLWENVRVDDFHNGAAFMLANAWEHTFVRCDSRGCLDGFRFGDDDEGRVANDITLHSCNSRRHRRDGCRIERTAGAVTLVGGNFAACGNCGVNVINTYGVSLYGTYHERNESADIRLGPAARGSIVKPGACFSDIGVSCLGSDVEVGGGRYAGDIAGVDIGREEGGSEVKNVVVLPFRYSGKGQKIRRNAAGGRVRILSQ